MNRHPALRPWSREHFTALLQVRDLEWAVQAADRDAIDTAVLALREAFRGDLATHFASEEQCLDAHVHGTLRERLDADHAALRESAGSLERQPVDPAAALAFAGLLRDHVRWEERVLYPHLERTLPAATLAAIEHGLSGAAGSAPACCD